MCGRTVDVCSNVPNELVLIETGFMPLKAVILIRQYKFYKRFKETLLTDSRRDKVFRKLQMERTDFLQHYESLINTYNNTDDIVCIFRNRIRTVIHERSQNGKYKYQI